MSNTFANDLLADNWDLKNQYGLDFNDFANLTFFINKEGKLECEECDLLDEDTQKAMSERRHDYRNEDENAFEPQHYFINKEFDLENFNGIEIGGAFHILISQGDDYHVEFMTEREQDMEDLDVRVNRDISEIDFEDRFHRNRGKVIAHVTMPNLTSIEAGGASVLKIVSFEDIASLDIELDGALKAKMDIEAKNVRLNATGASQIEIRALVERIVMDLTGSSQFEVKRAEIGTAKVEASGASHANFGKVENLDSNTSGASDVNRD